MRNLCLDHKDTVFLVKLCGLGLSIWVFVCGVRWGWRVLFPLPWLCSYSSIICFPPEGQFGAFVKTDNVNVVLLLKLFH